jgi:hypothetical protein
LRIARFTTFLLALSIAAMPIEASAEIAVKQIQPVAEVSKMTRALAVSGDVIALAGDSITILSRLSPDPGAAISLQGSSARLFTDLATLDGRLFAVGIGETLSSLATTPSKDVINPDSITLPGSPLSAEPLTRLVLLEFTATGEVIKESIFESNLPLIPLNIKVLDNAIAIVGTVVSERGVQGFLATSDLSLNFLAFNRFGSESTIIRSLASERILYGSSGERLAGSDRRGITDGVILYLDGSGVLTRVTRSFLASSERSWDHVSASHLAVGTVRRSGVSEVAITKFSPQGAPQWFTRFPGSDGHLDLRTVGFITSKKLSGVARISTKGKNAVFIEYAAKGLNKRGVISRITSIPARSITDMAGGYAVIVDREGRSQLVPLAP